MPEFDSLHAEPEWSEDVWQQVRTLAALFANALSRKEAATALESSEAFTGAVLAALPGETAIIDSAGVIMQVNEAWARFAGTVAGDSAGTIAVGDNYLAACRGVSACPPRVPARLSISSRPFFTGTRRRRDRVSVSRAGDDRWFEMRVRRSLVQAGARRSALRLTARRRAEATARAHLSQVAHMDRVFAMGSSRRRSPMS